MTSKDDLIRSLRNARAEGRRPEAPGADLRYANLREADLCGADLRGANLRSADLVGADLRGANLWSANLRGANLWDADLRDADLCGANLWSANLWDADLRGADLRYANLRGADLRGADLRGADLRGADLWGANLWGGFRFDGLPSGQVTMVPTPDGWHLTVGCWDGTRDQLRELVTQDEGWPQATGDEVARRRPGLLAMLALADAHAEYHADKLAAVIEKWGKR